MSGRPAAAPPTWRRAAVAAVAVLALWSCSDGASSSAPDDTSGPTSSTIARPEVPAVPEPSRAGTGVVVVGGTTSSFAVTACRLEPDPAEPAAARALVVVEGAGTTGSGVAFTIEVQRFATGTDVVTYTDTLTYVDSGRILQAQRIEVNGQVTDLRDERASTPLLRTRRDGVSAAALAGPPGSDADDEGVIGVALDATC